jgi:hypothetical protein
MVKLAGFVLLPILAFAQLTPNSVTVTASRDTSVKPDITRFTISVDAGVDASLEEVVAAASPAGVTAANFTGISYYQLSSAQPVTWSFAVTAPLSELKARLATLTALQNSLAKDKKFALSFVVGGSEVSPQSQTCSLTDLIADARAQAAKLASAAGMSVGAVQAVSGSVTGSAQSASGIGAATSVLSPTCSITVKFALGGF